MDRKGKIRLYLLPIIFMGMLTLPFLNSSLDIWKFERRDENRTFTDSLPFELQYIDSFPKNCEAYLNDNFSFRPPMLNMYHHIKFSVFGISPYPDKTIVGLDGWYFMAGKEKEIYEGAHDFTDADLANQLTEWQRRTRYLDSLDIKSYWVIAPLKHYVYSDKLPLNLYPSEKRRAIQLMDYFEKTLPNLIIDPVPELIANKDKEELYYRLGNHWNYHAGKIVTNLLTETFKADFPDKTIPSLVEYQWKDTTVKYGIHNRVLGIESLQETREFPYLNSFQSSESKKYGFPLLEWFPYPWEYERCFSNDSLDNGLRILFIRDSFAEHLMPFTRELFTESTFLFDGWQYQLHKDVVEQVRPDAVVFLGLEKFLERHIGNP